MNKLKELFKTTAVRLSLKYSILYLTILTIAFIILYEFVAHFIVDQLKANLKREKAKLYSIYNQGGIKALKTYISSHEQFKGEDHMYYLLINKKGKIVIGDLKKWPDSVKVGSPIENIWISKKDIVGKIFDGDGLWPALAVILPDKYKLLIAEGIKGTEDLRETLFTIMIIIFGFIVILTLMLGMWLGKNILWHTNKIKEACEEIVNGDLSKRITISPRNDEFDTISKYINYTLDKLANFIKQSQDTAKNIAHDIKTPLNRIRNKLELLMLNNQDANQYFENIIYDLDQTIKLVNSILEIAQLETGALRKNWEKIEITEILKNVIEFYGPFAEERNIKIKFEINNPIFISGNKHLLSQVFVNIFDNAIKYTQKGGLVKVMIKKEKKYITISICDNGPGIKPEYYEKITEKFFTVGSLSNQNTQNSKGLGLSIVKAICELHDCQLIFSDNNPGLCVNLKFKKYPENISLKLT